MALWKQALAKLRGSAPSDGGESDVALVETGDSIPGASSAAEEGGTTRAAVDKNALARELRSGIQVNIGDLDTNGAGWSYRGHPVMVFGTDAPELDDPQRRKDFFSLMHVYPCCGALESETRTAWVTTDLRWVNETHGEGPYRQCKACVEAAGGRGASPEGFDFTAHVCSHGDSYFNETACFWQPGTNKVPLQSPAEESELSCPHCGCAAKEDGWQLSGADAKVLKLAEGSCVLCAERRVDGCLHLESTQLLAAARIRYQFLTAQASRAPAPSWKLAEAILPLGWQPLLQSLQRMLPPPQLFYPYAEGSTAAVLAWPELRRGVVEMVTEERVAQAAPDWNLWTRAQIEAELGFKLR